MQGINQSGRLYYEVEGYAVFTVAHFVKFDDKGVKNILKRYNLHKGLDPTTDSHFPTAKVFQQIDSSEPNVPTTTFCYLFPVPGDSVRLVHIATAHKRDRQLEKFLVNACLNGSIPPYVFVSAVVDSFKFAGRTIVLGNACHWMGSPHNVQCPDLGQMNWSEFRSREKAQQMIDDQFYHTNHKPMGELLKQDTVNIVFEGVDVKAIKTRYKIKLPTIVMGGSNVLIIYYVVAPVRGKYVGCVLSHYTDDVGAATMPPLLSEVMKLKD